MYKYIKCTKVFRKKTHNRRFRPKKVLFGHQYRGPYSGETFYALYRILLFIRNFTVSVQK